MSKEKVVGEIKQSTIAEFMRKRTQLVGFEFGFNKHMQYVAEFLDNALDAIESFYWRFPEAYSLENNISNDILDEIVSKTKDMIEKNKENELKEFRAAEEVIEHVKEFVKPIKTLLDMKEPVVVIWLREVETPTFLSNAHRENVRVYEFTIFDNGGGMVPQDLKKFGIYLASSKSEKLRQTRGSQGFGAPSAFTDAQNTTGKPITVVSKHYSRDKATVASFFTTTKNTKDYVIHPRSVEPPFPHGTFVKLYYLNIMYKRGYADVYVERAALLNAHVTIVFIDPYNEIHVYPRRVSEFPPEPKYAKPHPASVNIGEFQDLLRDTKQKTLLSFLSKTFSRMSSEKAKKIIEETNEELKKLGLPLIAKNTDPKKLTKKQIEVLFKVFTSQKYLAPSKDTVVPVGAEVFKKVVKEMLKPEFVEAVTRPPTSGKGLSYVVEACIAYGGEIPYTTSSSQVLWRFVNRTPKLRDNSDCAIWKAAASVNWKNYKLDVFENGLPRGPVRLFVHVAGPFVHVMFKGQSKQALAEDKLLIREIKLALEEVARKLRSYITGKETAERKAKRAYVLSKYAEKFAKSLYNILKTDVEFDGSIDPETLLRKMKSSIEGVEETLEEVAIVEASGS